SPHCTCGRGRSFPAVHCRGSRPTGLRAHTGRHPPGVVRARPDVLVPDRPAVPCGSAFGDRERGGVLMVSNEDRESARKEAIKAVAWVLSSGVEQDMKYFRGTA